MKQIIKIAKWILSIFDIGVYRISMVGSAQGMPISDPVEHNSLEKLNEYYGDPNIVAEYLEPARKEFYNKIINFINEKNIVIDSKKICDVGCGPGMLLGKLSEHFSPGSLVGYEYSSSAISVASKMWPKVKFEEFDIYKGTKEKYDIVFCTEVIEHLLEPEKAIETLVSMVADDGIVIVTVPNGRIDTFLGHINFWSPESWKHFIDYNAHGLSYEICNIAAANCAIMKKG